MRTMYDSTNAALIPASAQLVAGYVNGRYAWSAADWARFPGVPHIRIDVDGSMPSSSDVLDVEPGDATTATAVAWVKQRQARGWWSAVYCNLGIYPALSAALKGLHVVAWVADWTGQPHMPVTLNGVRVVACQYASGQNWDESCVADDWFPSPAQAPAPPKVTQAQALAAVQLLTNYVEGK